MPEIAEVALNVELFLHEYLLDRDLEDIEILSGKYQKKKPSNFNRFLEDLPAKVTSVNTRGKFIWVELDNDWIIGIGFGMTGRFTLDEDMKHNRLVLYGGSEDIYYNDMRNFGNWFFWDDESCLEKKLRELGPDLLQNDNFSKKKVVELFRKYDHWEITKAIMSQRVLAGGGNYIKCEALYETRIYPYAKVGDLSDEVLYKLYKNMVAWAKRAYRLQRQNVLEGVPYEAFQEHMKIYNKKFDPKGNKVTRSTNTADKRTTHWVKEVQTIGK